MRLLIRGGIGDSLVATATVRNLRRARPDEMITLFEPEYPDVWRGNPHLNRGNLDDGKLYRLYSLERGHVGTVAEHQCQNILGVPCFDSTPELFLTADERAYDGGLPAEARVLAVDPWASWPSRVWPLARYREVVAALRVRGWFVVEIGSGDGVRGLPSDLSLVGRCTLRQSAAVLARCALYLGNDSGPFHLAAAVGCPQVILYAHTRQNTGPYWNTLALPREPYPCDPNCYRHCVLKARAKTHRTQHCMEAITVSQVVDAVERHAEAYARR